MGVRLIRSPRGTFVTCVNAAVLTDAIAEAASLVFVQLCEKTLPKIVWNIMYEYYVVK